MNKKFLSAMISLVAVTALSSCGSDSGSGSAQDASSIDRSNPTGTISDDNATELTNAAIEVGAVEGITGATPFKLAPRSRESVARSIISKASKASKYTQEGLPSCFTVSDDGLTGSIDFSDAECQAYFGETECTISGSISWSYDVVPSGDEPYTTTITYSNFEYECDGFGISACNGSSSSYYPNGTTDYTNAVTCSDLTCTYDGIVQNSAGCSFNDGALYIDDSTGGVICESYDLAVDCSTISSVWTDVLGSASIDCSVECNDDGVPTLASDCVFARSE